MKKYTVVGFNRYEGEFNGQKYGGYYLHCLTDSASDDFTGQRTVQIKAKDKYHYVPRLGDQIVVEYGENGIEAIEACYA